MDENTPQSPASPETGTTDPNRLLYGAPPPGLRGTRKRTLGTWLWPVVILVVVAVGVLYIIGHNNDQPANPGRGGRRGGGYSPFIPVNAVTAQMGDMPVYLDALGTVTPTATVTVRSQVSGVLQSVNFAEGQMVAKGQVLAQVDPRQFQASLMQAQGNLARDEAQLAAARVDLQRYRTLLAQNSISAQQVDQQAAQVGQLEGSVQADRANVQTQTLNLNYARITAPISGRVGLRQVDPGNYVTTGDANGIVAITQQSPIDVTFTLPEDQVQTVTQRLHAGNKLPVYVLDRVQSNTLATGTLVSTDNLIDATTGTLRAKARFDNVGGALFPSQFVNVRVLVDQLHNVVLVPSSSILHGQEGLFVYVADAKGAVHVTPVTIGAAANDKTAILSGVTPGAQVITDGTDRLHEGACVTVPGQGAPDMTGFGRKRGGGKRGAQGQGASSGGADEKKPGFFGNLFGGGSSSSAGGRGKGGGGNSPCGGGSGGGAHRHGGAAAQPGSENAAPPPAASGGHVAQPAQGAAPAVSGTPAATKAPSEAGHKGNGGGTGRTAALLAQLDLTPDQQAKADAIMAQARPQAQAAPDPDAKRQVWIGAMQQIQAILTPAQQTKLKALRAAQRAQNGSANQQQPQ